MPKKYRRSCDWCGRKYHGEGKRFCSQKCDVERRQQAADARDVGFVTEPDERIRSKDTDAGRYVYVEASAQITTHEELLERAGINLDEWTVKRVPLRTWTVPMKVNDEPHVIQLHYVGVELVPHVSNSWDLKPLEIVIKNPLPKPPTSGGFSTSFHFSDVHVPYQDDPAVDVAMSLMDDLKPDGVYCHGDLVDCTQLSKYEKNPFERTPQHEENRLAATLLGEVTAITRHADHWFLAGNHEDRARAAMWKAAEDRRLGELIHLKGVREALSWDNQLGLSSLGWGFTPYGEHKLLRNRLVLCHGDKVRKHSAQSAKAEHDTYRKSGLSGHTHRMGTYYDTAYDGQVQTWIEIGCLCDTNPRYIKGPANWQQAVVVVTWDGEHYGIEHVGIHDGRAIFRGKSYGTRFRGTTDTVNAA